MSGRRYWLAIMVVLALIFFAQFPLSIRAFQEEAAAPAKADWLQFGFTPDKAANNTSETAINVGNVAKLTPLFSVPLPAADNSDGAPVLLTNVSTPNGVHDLIFTLGEHGHVTAFDADTGAIVWAKVFAGGGSNNVAPILDLNRMFVYVDAPDGMVHKLNVSDGSEVTAGGWPKSLGTGKAGAEPTIATAKNGHTYLYVAHHGHGHVVTFDLTDGTQHVFNLACSQFPDVLDPAGCTERGANPWSRNNPYDAALDRFLIGTGTNDGTHWVAGSIWRQSWVSLPADGSTHMMNGGGFPADSYTPTDWATSVAQDRDICSGGLAILPEGLSSKFPHLAVNPGKDAKIRLLNLDNMSGQGGPGHLGGEIQLLSFPTGSLMRAASAVWTNPADGRVWVFVTGNSGLHGFTVDVDAAGNPSLHNQWNLNNGWTTSAVVANGVVFAAVGGGEHSSTTGTHRLQAVNPTTGAVLWTGALGAFHWASPIVVNGTVYMSDGNSGGFGGNAGVLRAWRVPGIDLDFSINATPPAQRVSQGSSATYTVNVSASSTFTGNVSLGVTGLPAGATASFSPNPVTGGSGSSTLTISAASTTPVGTYTLTITGSSGPLTHSAPVTLSVFCPCPEFAVAASPSSQAVFAGGNTSYTVTVFPVNGFTGIVALTVSGQPVGVTATFSPASINASGTSTLNVSLGATTPPGSYVLTITGTSGSLSHSIEVILVVDAQSSCVTATGGGTFVNTPFTGQTGTFTATFDVTPSLSHMNSVVGLSHGAGTAYSGFANLVAFNGTMGTILARNGGVYAGPTPAIPYSGGNTYHFRLAINIPAHTYSIFVTPPGGTELTVGSNFAFRTEQNTVTSLDHYGVFVGATSGRLQVCNFTLLNSGAGASASAATENASIAASAAPATFSVSATPSSQTVNAGNSTAYSVNVTALSGNGGTTYPASLGTLAGRAVKVPCATCPSGFRVAQLLGHAPMGRGTDTFVGINAPKDGTYQTTWYYFCGKSDNNGDKTCGGQPHTASGCRPGIFVVNGVQLPGVNQFQCFPGTWQETHIATFNVPLKAGSNSLKIFSNSADCPDLDRIVVADGTGGTGSETVTLSVSGLPAGATPTFAPASVTGSGSSMLTVSTTNTVTPGTYPLTITGTFGTEMETAAVTLVVNGPPPPQDFRLSATCPNPAVVGGSAACTVTVNGINGYAKAVTLSATGLPAGASAAFSPDPVVAGSSSTLSISTSSSTPPGSSQITICGTDGTLTHCNSVPFVVSPPSPCVTATGGGAFVNTPFVAQTGTFTATFDATPSLSHMNSVVALSHGAGTTYTAFANLVAFNGTAGTILARNGGSYAGPTPAIPYSGGNTYHFRLAINIPSHTYSIFVTPPGGSELTVGSNFVFRMEQNTVTSLDHYGVFVGATSGALRVCNFAVQ